ncbi:HD-GYP domain-containing protein [Lacticigenium naphthae]|uniref:HD-GYP domain-containing protein n=1 Tax=Lacticigenium naphthae TaxID=515351 RepID=UPI000406243C|nr:HD-GYP domain-containing protein [Lacticigenium naphthae]
MKVNQITQEILMEEVKEEWISLFLNTEDWAGIHQQTVCTYCNAFGKELNLSSEKLKELQIAGLFHDIGKLVTPNEMLNKPADLTIQEFQEMKKHTVHGYHLLQKSKAYRHLAEIVLYHHENFDGTGYPEGLKGENIPLFSRILSIVDSYDAMTSERPYSKGKTKVEAIETLQKQAGKQYDAKLVTLFINKILPTIDLNRSV